MASDSSFLAFVSVLFLFFFILTILTGALHTSVDSTWSTSQKNECNGALVMAVFGLLVSFAAVAYFGVKFYKAHKHEITGPKGLFNSGNKLA